MFREWFVLYTQFDIIVCASKPTLFSGYIIGYSIVSGETSNRMFFSMKISRILFQCMVRLPGLYGCTGLFCFVGFFLIVAISLTGVVTNVIIFVSKSVCNPNLWTVFVGSLDNLIRWIVLAANQSVFMPA